MSCTFAPPDQIGLLKPLYFHLLGAALSISLFLLTVTQKVTFSKPKDGNQHASVTQTAYDAAMFLTTLEQPVSGVSAHSLIPPKNGGWQGRLVAIFIQPFLSCFFTKWWWKIKSDTVVAEVPRASAASFVSAGLGIAQMAVMFQPCANNGFFWDERCWTGILEGGAISPYLLCILVACLYEQLDLTILPVWEEYKTTPCGSFAYYVTWLYLIILVIQAAIAFVVALTVQWMYGFVFVLIALLFWLGLCALIFCVRHCWGQKGERCFTVSMHVAYALILLAASLLLFWGIFAGGKFYEAVRQGQSPSYWDTFVCTWHERSSEAYVSGTFSSFRAWISTF